MYLLVELFTRSLNAQLAASLILLVLLALRPVTTRLITPQTRCILWIPGLLMFLVINSFFWMKYIPRLPVTLMDLITPQKIWGEGVPPFLPQYQGTGWYTLALPRGGEYSFAVSDWMVTAVSALWVVGIIALLCLLPQQGHRGRRYCRKGEYLSWDDPRLAGIERVDKVGIYLCDGLSTSYVEYASRGKNKYTVFLQRELSPEQMKLVLRHELSHVKLCHCWIKGFLTIGLLFGWWNPLVWLAYRCACRDMEEASDRATLEQLWPEQRREYVRLLVDLGAGRLMWEAPLCFEECDAAFRVRRVAKWKPVTLERFVLGLGTAALLFAFCYGPPHPERVLGVTMAQDWQSWQPTGIQWVLDWAEKEGFQPGPLYLHLDEPEEVVYLRFQDTKTGQWHYRMFHWDYTQEEHFTSNSWGSYAETPDFEGYQRLGVEGGTA